MKKKLLIFLFFTILFNQSYAQTTTMEEYNFITKGYKIQLESGLDMKKGYTLSSLSEFISLDFGDAANQGRRGMVFKGLFRNSETKPCAIMAIYQRRVNDVTQFEEYYCLPMPIDNSAWTKTLEQINSNWSNDNAKQMYIAMLWALMKFSSKEASK